MFCINAAELYTWDKGKFLLVTNSVTHLFHLYHYLMQSSTAMQQSCTHASEQGEGEKVGGRGGDGGGVGEQLGG